MHGKDGFMIKPLNTHQSHNECVLGLLIEMLGVGVYHVTISKFLSLISSAVEGITSRLFI